MALLIITECIIGGLSFYKDLNNLSNIGQSKAIRLLMHSAEKKSILTILRLEVTTFDCLKELYEIDGDFAQIWDQCQNKIQSQSFRIHEGFLSKLNRLCIPQTSFRLQLIRQIHSGGLAGHFGRDKNLKQLEEVLLARAEEGS